jgi:transposase
MKTSRQSIKLEGEQRKLLEEWVRAHRTPQQVVKRCQIILRSTDGKSDEAIAKELDINRHTCRLWRERFARCGADCLWEVEAGRGRKSQAGLAQRIIEATLHAKPSGQTHWTTRKMAKEQGVHASTVARIWQEHELKPHRQKTFKLSRDPKFVEKLLDVVGIYLNPVARQILSWHQRRINSWEKWVQRLTRAWEVSSSARTSKI